MMNEIKSKENSEIKMPESNTYKEIKPDNKTTYLDSKQFWNEEFSDKDTIKLKVSNIDKKIGTESIEKDKEGGSFREVKKNSNGQIEEVHHMPADSVSPIERSLGPAIKMDKEDHRQTASCGSSIEAREYQAAQREKIEKGDFRGAVQMDIDDIKEKFGNKYDKAIEQLLQYVDKLEEEGRI